jgi:hypothetical protein
VVHDLKRGGRKKREREREKERREEKKLYTQFKVILKLINTTHLQKMSFRMTLN